MLGLLKSGKLTLRCVQQDSGEERVTAKSRPMMSLIAIVPSNVSSSTSESPGEEKLWKSKSLECASWERGEIGAPVVTSWGKTRESQPSFFHERTQHDGTAQSIVNEAIPRDRPGQPVVNPQRRARSQQFIIGNDETESELSVESRSFLSRVNDQVRKRHKRSSMNVTKDGEKHSVIWGMFMSVTMESAVFM